MYSKLFHKDVFMPCGLQDKVKRLQRFATGFELSKHLAQRISETDRSHDYSAEDVMRALESLRKDPKEAFEVEFGKDYHYFGYHGWDVVKFCVRVPRGDGSDVCLALSPWHSGGKPKVLFVRTAWLNSASDAHSTLKAGAYCDEEEWFRCM